MRGAVKWDPFLSPYRKMPHFSGTGSDVAGAFFVKTAEKHRLVSPNDIACSFGVIIIT